MTSQRSSAAKARMLCRDDETHDCARLFFCLNLRSPCPVVQVYRTNTPPSVRDLLVRVGAAILLFLRVFMTHGIETLTMCLLLIERYSVCQCLYYQHAVDRCPQYGQPGHSVAGRTIWVGSTCNKHHKKSRYAASSCRSSSFPARKFGRRESLDFSL